jgi:hypothetical protein
MAGRLVGQQRPIRRNYPIGQHLAEVRVLEIVTEQ